ncbi:hypothetical protein TNCV_1236061 [Trichonephila clavipes]|nr:hypothetical protein TNCV_1236061 [Trichonephila clavipes]
MVGIPSCKTQITAFPLDLLPAPGNRSNETHDMKRWIWERRRREGSEREENGGAVARKTGSDKRKTARRWESQLDFRLPPDGINYLRIANIKKKDGFPPDPGTISLREKNINLITGKTFKIKTGCIFQILINTIREKTEYLLNLGVNEMGQSIRTLLAVLLVVETDQAIEEPAEIMHINLDSEIRMPKSKAQRRKEFRERKEKEKLAASPE